MDEKSLDVLRSIIIDRKTVDCPRCKSPMPATIDRDVISVHCSGCGEVGRRFYITATGYFSLNTPIETR